MAWDLYHPYIKATVDSTEFTIPTVNLRVSNAPVSKSGAFALELINSNYVQTFDGWHVLAELDYPELSNGYNDTIREFIEAVLDYGTCIMDFDPEDDFPSEDRTVDFVLLSAPNAVNATFTGRVRSRRSAFQLKSRRLFTEPKVWIIK